MPLSAQEPGLVLEFTPYTQYERELRKPAQSSEAPQKLLMLNETCRLCNPVPVMMSDAAPRPRHSALDTYSKGEAGGAAEKRPAQQPLRPHALL
jgi:hypothetical protein